ncbi:MAG: DUF484 family protein [Gammaproteobacteria bacterium]|nr:DUF484 family protein [Gammaproteobacteria bacterium]NIR81839.1 DUF484 family protein [Gammaproteobacteria bacterium]NIR88671.1 DUF484 family protein [Gammaproteobacteria bacterium]NIU02947.1 DUF484 family protein [Gammaproteobacteria bacterium]NIV50468.1 DUF484 family protein [Gammaproteobacteria bacterium]
MKPTEGGELRADAGTEEGDIAEYLREHPDFFLRHPDLLEKLHVPHACGEAVSLVEYQISLLRERNQRLRKKTQELVNNARRNEELSRRLHRLTLGLLECAGVDDVFATLYGMLVNDFNADMVAIRLFGRPVSPGDTGLAEFAENNIQGARLFESVFAEGKPVCGWLQTTQLAYLFGDRAAEVGSAALLPLADHLPFGVLAIASRSAQRFHAGMGTLFLRQLSEVVARIIAPHVVRD